MPIRIRIRRHAERPTTGEGHGGAQTPLTEKGKQHAFLLGKKLKGKQQTHFYSTPIGRSVETARQIAKGANRKNAKIHIREGLTRFIKPHSPSESQTLTRLLTPPAHEVIRDWLQGKLPKHLFYSPHEMAVHMAYTMRHALRGTEKLYQWHARAAEEKRRTTGKKVPRRNPFINIEAIAHDVTIVALVHALTGNPPAIRGENYADFLEHAELQFKPTKSGIMGVRLLFRGKPYDVTRRFNELVKEGRS